MAREISSIHCQDHGKPFINIVLFEPEIPQNTGTIGRLCVCLNARLHLIEPLGFKIDENKIRRAGMDYWKHLDLHIHKNWQAFLDKESPEEMTFVTTKTDTVYFEHTFSENEYLVFGKESAGLPDEFYDIHSANMVTIPMPGQHSRSHNLANSVSIIGYEALRQIKYSN